jgi:hypothetical protein
LVFDIFVFDLGDDGRAGRVAIAGQHLDAPNAVVRGADMADCAIDVPKK